MNNPDMSHIFNNPELKDLMGNIFKSINQNIKKNMDTEDNSGDMKDTFHSNDDINDAENVSFKKEIDSEETDIDTNDSEEEVEYKKDIDIKKKYIDKDSSDSNLIDMLLYLFLDRNGNNIADILTDLSTNIAENNQLIKKNIETRNNRLKKPTTFYQNVNKDVIELD